MENKTTETTRVPYTINFTEHAKFGAVGEIEITTSNELSKLINDIFVNAFADYAGCRLTCQFMNQERFMIVPTLWFNILDNAAYEDDTKHFAFKPIGSNKPNAVLERVQRVSSIATSKGISAEITEDGKDILKLFTINPAAPMKNYQFDWKKCFKPHPMDTGMYLEVFKLDILKFVQAIYGDKTEDGARLFYQITPNRLVGLNNGMMNYKMTDNWVLNILALNEKELSAAADLLGLARPTYGEPDFIKATR